MPPSASAAGPFRLPVGERVLFRCVLASIALHVLVLLGLSWTGAAAPPAKALSVLTARLAQFAAGPPAAVPLPVPGLVSPPTPEQASALRPKLAVPVAAPAPAPQVAAPADATKARQTELAPAVTGAAVSPAQTLAPVPNRTAPQAPAGMPAAESAARPGDEVERGSVAQYRLALIVATRRYKRYPAIAMEKGWQGRVEVHMVIGADGMTASASIKTGSGHDILDDQALEMLNKGKTVVPVPGNLRGREFSIDVPVIFNLDDPNS